MTTVVTRQRTFSDFNSGRTASASFSHTFLTASVICMGWGTTALTRFKNGDPLTVQTLARIAALAREGREALLKRDYETLNRLIDENFDCRRKIMNISPSNLEMVETARACGASAKFSGSGGAIVGMYPSDEALSRLIAALRKIDVRVIRPFVN